MIFRALYITAFIAGLITIFIAYQDRNFSVLQTVQIPLTIEAVSFSKTNESKTKHGNLIWRGGLKISSPHQRFGGLSGLEISPDGKDVLAITDKGLWFKGRLGYDQDGDLLSLSHGQLSSLKGTGGTALTRKKDRDSESIAIADDGAIYVSFERRHRILKYANSLSSDAEPIPFPDAFLNTSKNKGIEALTWLPGGCLLAIPEHVTSLQDQSKNPRPEAQDKLIQAFIWDQFSWSSIYLKSNGDFLPTGLSVTPKGDILLLERSFSLLEGFKASLRFFPAEQIQPDKTMEGYVLATFEDQYAVDNMEGISSRLGPNGETFIYLLSDDNLSFTQDTLLLMFEIDKEFSVTYLKQRKPVGLRTTGCSKNRSAYSAALATKAF
ncbi:esterase-like activity of phytase family protein [Kiloniella antarctica]|uniref:Esterase-like activity of phytase family protein n=1 Tax=Kiloniella antarctica TaxID=1550907 RepID=A0ABW5BMS0_9PROT